MHFAGKQPKRMKQYLLVFLLCVIVFSSGIAADAPPTVHWYTVTLTEGNTSRNFTGSSELDANQFAAAILTSNSIVSLTNLRNFGPSGGATYRWFPEPGGKLFIVGRTVLYFRELAADPATQEAQHR